MGGAASRKMSRLRLRSASEIMVKGIRSRMTVSLAVISSRPRSRAAATSRPARNESGWSSPGSTTSMPHIAPNLRGQARKGRLAVSTLEK